jgi:dTDP-4-dehydrorhamnose reductase
VKILVIGGGQVGAALLATAAADAHHVIGCTRAQLDLTNGDRIRAVIKEIKPDWVVNAAAYTAVDRAEDARAEATMVNDAAVAVLADSAAREDCRLLHLSTDFVFDGSSNRAYLPGDIPHPLSVYGATKLAGERHVISIPSGVVLRTSWVYASTGKNFVLTMLRLMKEKEQLGVVSDQIGSPTWASSVAAACWGFMDAAAPGGIYHWTDLGIASWYDFAVAIQDEALTRGLLTRVARILPISTAAYPTSAKRPRFSVLDTATSRAAIKTPARHWRHNLRAMMDEIRTV